jgi:hypothetical protein
MSFPKLSIIQILSLFTILVMVVMALLVFSSDLFDAALPGWRRYAFGAVIGLYAFVRSRRIIKQLKS